LKKNTILILITLLLLPVMALGCQSKGLDTGEPAVILELTYDDFTAQPNITRDIEITRPKSLTVTLYSNPTTGFQWGEVAVISQSNIIEQVSHNFVEPQVSRGVVGAPGKDVWVFDSKAAGNATIKFSYGRPWEGGEKDTWTVTLNVTVK